MSKNKKKIDNKKWEAVGDAILKLVVAENLKKLPHSVNGMFIINYLTSNKVLSIVRDSRDFPIRYKHSIFVTSEESKGDEVEYYIGLLYFNFGIECAKRFVFNRIVAKYIIL